MTATSGDAAARRPHRAARAVDAVALLCLAGGALTYVYADRGMTALAAGALRHAGGVAGAMPNLDEWVRLDRLSKIGLGVAAAGIVLSLAAHLASRVRRQPAPHT